MRCIVCTFSLKSCTVDLIVRFTEVFRLFCFVFLFPLFCAIVLCPYCGLTPHVVHCVLCTLKSVVASKETKNNKKNIILLQFHCEITTNPIFSA